MDSVCAAGSGLTLATQPVLAAVLLAVTQLHLVQVKVVLVLVVFVLVVAVLSERTDQLHKDLIVDETALFGEEGGQF